MSSGCRKNSELVASSDEDWWYCPSNLLAPCDMEQEGVFAFDQEDWDDPKAEAHSKSDVEPP